MARKLVDADGLRKELGNSLTDFKLADYRRKRRIPYHRLGHRLIMYDIDRVRAALDRMEVKEVV
jgi:hypothetical protein